MLGKKILICFRAVQVKEKKISHVMFERLPFKDGHFFYHWLEYRAEVTNARATDTTIASFLLPQLT